MGKIFGYDARAGFVLLGELFIALGGRRGGWSFGSKIIDGGRSCDVNRGRAELGIIEEKGSLCSSNWRC